VCVSSSSSLSRSSRSDQANSVTKKRKLEKDLTLQNQEEGRREKEGRRALRIFCRSMKGRTSDVVTAKTRKTADQNEHFDTLPLLSPEILQVEEEQERCFDDEGNHDELEEGSGAACCRICLESESPTPGDELIAPCMCKGTNQFVHRDCLDHWRSVKEGFAFSHCTTCKAQFHLRPELPEDYSWRQLKFKFFVTRDIFLVFLVLQTVRKSHSYISWFALPWQVPSIPTINLSS
jgi:hypothetical protein